MISRLGRNKCRDKEDRLCKTGDVTKWALINVEDEKSPDTTGQVRVISDSGRRSFRSLTVI